LRCGFVILIDFFKFVFFFFPPLVISQYELLFSLWQVEDVRASFHLFKAPISLGFHGTASCCGASMWRIKTVLPAQSVPPSLLAL